MPNFNNTTRTFWYHDICFFWYFWVLFMFLITGKSIGLESGVQVQATDDKVISEPRRSRIDCFLYFWRFSCKYDWLLYSIVMLLRRWRRLFVCTVWCASVICVVDSIPTRRKKRWILAHCYLMFRCGLKHKHPIHPEISQWQCKTKTI